jgi:hypothetical protein
MQEKSLHESTKHIFPVENLSKSFQVFGRSLVAIFSIFHSFRQNVYNRQPVAGGRWQYLYNVL